MEMNKENYNKIFDIDFLNENYNFNQENFFDKNIESNEFKDDIKNMLSNSNARRIQIKQKKNNDKDYLIFDVEKNLFYRKMNIINIKDVNMINKNGNDYNNNNYRNNFDKNLLDSPKTIVRIQKLPIKIKEDYII
jgi:hypothetical protein